MLLQEPRLVNGKPSVLRRQKFFSAEDGRAAIYVPELKSASFMVLPSFLRKDIVAGLLEWEGKTLIIASVYFHALKEEVLPEWVELVEYCKYNRLPLLCGCDTNAWSHIWFSRRENERGRNLEQYILAEGIIVCNDDIAPTYVDKGPGGSTIETHIDVTMTLNCPYEIREWTVHSDSFISDHKPITFKLKSSKIPLVMRRNYKKADWGKFSDIIQAEMPKIKNGNWSQQRIEDETAILYKFINRALDLVCPKYPCKRSKNHPWWNEDCEEKKKAFKSLERKVFRQAKRFGGGKPSEAEWQALKRAKSQYSGAIYTAKKESWREFTHNIESIPDMSKLYKVISTAPATEVGLVRKADGTMCHSSDETLEVLLKEHFPDCRINEELGCVPSKTSKPLGYFPWINNSTITQAIKEFGAHKSPGPDEVKPVVLHHLPDRAISRLTEITKACIDLAYTPMCWRKSKIIFISKPGKPDKANPRSHRPISLTSYLLKSVERVVKYFIEDIVLPEFPFHREQFAFQKDKGTDHALSATIDSMEKGLGQNEFMIVIFLDIQGAFDNITPDAILQSMIDSNFPEPIRNWYYNLLTNREGECKLGQCTKNAVLVRGCPQGGVLSPPLGWLPSMDKFLKKFDNTPTSKVGFADDGKLSVQGIDEHSIRDIAQDAINQAVQWADEHGLKFSPSKTQVIFCTKKRKFDMPAPLSMYGKEIPYVTSSKYLGITIDSKLNWQKHIDDKIKKTKRALMAARNAIAHSWGPKPKYMHWLYKQVIRPSVTYGCYVWAKAVSTDAYSIRKLRSLQRLGLSMIAPVRQGTPTMVLEIMYGVEPLHLHIQYLAMATHLRLGNKLKWAPRGTSRKPASHITHAEKLLPNTLLNVKLDKEKFHREWDHAYNVEIGDGKLDNWTPQDHDWSCFTDGSLLNERSGAGAVIYNNTNDTTELQEQLKNATVFQSELRAIETAANWLVNKDVKYRSICFYVDNQSALRDLSATQCTKTTVKRARDALSILGLRNLVHLKWVRAHCGQTGNELADKAAKNATTCNNVITDIPLSITSAKNDLRNQIYIFWQKEWDSRTDMRQSKYLLEGPDNLKFKHILQYGRETISQTIRFVTGFSFHKSHSMTVKYGTKYHGEDVTCRLCKEEGTKETPHHIITECPILMNERAECFEHRFLNKHFREWSLDQMIRFLSNHRVQNHEMWPLEDD